MKDFIRWLLVCVLAVLLFVAIVTKAHGQGMPFVRVMHDSFVSYYDIQRHNPAMVVYELELSHFAGNCKVSGRHFKADTKLPRPRVKDNDYSKSGYVRGHLCSAGDRDSNKKWLKETYLTSNLVPMSMVCNSGAWRVIEDSCRQLATLGHRLIVCRFPYYGDIPRFIGDVVRIDVPEGFICAARCRDCSLHFFAAVRNTRQDHDAYYISGSYKSKSICTTRSSVYYEYQWPTEFVSQNRSREDIPRVTCSVWYNHGTNEAANVVRTRYVTHSEYNSGMDAAESVQSVLHTARKHVTRSLGEFSLAAEISPRESVTLSPQDVPRAIYDERIAILLTNILGLWSREEYETITR